MLNFRYHGKNTGKISAFPWLFCTFASRFLMYQNLNDHSLYFLQRYEYLLDYAKKYVEMTFDEIKKMISGDEHRTLELKKTTGELKEGMKSACAFLNTEGGHLIFGITPTSLKIEGQIVTDNTQRELAREIAKIEPGIDVRAEYIEVPCTKGQHLIVFHFDAWQEGQVPYTYDGRPYYRIESTTKVMPREMYDERLRLSNPNKFAWEVQEAEGVTIEDLSEERIRNAVRVGVAGGRINASAESDSVMTLLEKFKLIHNGKIINDYLAIKDKAIAKKLDIAKLLADIYHHNGDVKGALENGEAAKNMSFNFDDIRKIVDDSMNEKEKTKTIQLNKK